MPDVELWRILVPLLFAHLVTDFLLQNRTMVSRKSEDNLMSGWLYLHAFIAGTTAWLFTGIWTLHQLFWVTAVTHFGIDAWKGSRKNSESPVIFLIDQLLHLVVIAGLCVWVIGPDSFAGAAAAWPWREAGIVGVGFLFLLQPASILIQKLFSGWENLPIQNELPGAGHYIGLLERVLLYVFILFSQFAAIGLLIAAKSILRYGSRSTDRRETEYILIGTLLSFSIALLTGLLVRAVL